MLEILIAAQDLDYVHTTKTEQETEDISATGSAKNDFGEVHEKRERRKRSTQGNMKERRKVKIGGALTGGRNNR